MELRHLEYVQYKFGLQYYIVDLKSELLTLEERHQEYFLSLFHAQNQLVSFYIENPFLFCLPQ